MKPIFSKIGQNEIILRFSTPKRYFFYQNWKNLIFVPQPLDRPYSKLYKNINNSCMCNVWDTTLVLDQGRLPNSRQTIGMQCSG